MKKYHVMPSSWDVPESYFSECQNCGKLTKVRMMPDPRMWAKMKKLKDIEVCLCCYEQEVKQWGEVKDQHIMCSCK